jgi:hypothetical protein
MTLFLIWFFEGLSGLGGWLIFLVAALAGAIFIFAHAGAHRIPAVLFKVGALVGLLLLAPAAVLRFAVGPFLAAIIPFSDAIFYIGVIGGLLPVLLAVGYLMTYHGMRGCPNGHIYDQRLKVCPVCSGVDEGFPEYPGGREAYPPTAGYRVDPPPFPVEKWEPATDIGGFSGSDLIGGYSGGFLGESTQVGNGGVADFGGKKLAQAWLVDDDGRSHQLYSEETTIGRLSENDLQFSESTIGRRHAKIVEENGHYRLFDLASTNGTRVNGRLIRRGTLIESDDKIQIGDEVILTFKV